MKLKKVLSFVLVVMVLIPSAILFTGCSATGTYRITELNVSYDREEQLVTYSDYKKSYGKDDFDYNSATATEKYTAMYTASAFSVKYKLTRDGKMIAKYDYPDWYLSWYNLEEQPEDEEVGTWKDGDTDSEIIFNNVVVCKRDGNKFYYKGWEYKKC